MSLYLALLVCDMASEKDIVIQTSIEIIVRAASNRSASVLDELSLGHFVLDVWGA